MSPRMLRSRLVAMATAMCEREIVKRLDRLADSQEPLLTDPDAPEVDALREHCRRELAEHESDRQRKVKR